MYQDSPQELRRMNYCNGVQDFINYAISNLRNISGDGIRYLYKRCKNNKFLNPDVVMMYLLQKKGSRSNTLVDMHMENHIFLTRLW